MMQTWAEQRDEAASALEAISTFQLFAMFPDEESARGYRVAG